MIFFEGYPVGLAGGGTRAREGGSRGFGAGGVGGRGTGPRDGANFATCVVFLTFRTKRRKKIFLKDTLWGGGAYKGSGGGVRGRGTGPRDGALTRTKRRKMMFFEGCPVGWGGTHRSWPGGQGGKPRALVAGGGWRA